MRWSVESARYSADCGSPKAASTAAVKRAGGSRAEVQFFDGFAGRAPGIGLVSGHRILDAEYEVLKVVLELDVQPVGQRGDARVVAVVGLHAAGKAFGAIAVEQVEALAHVGIGVPAVDHALVEAVDIEQRLAGDKLKIAGLNRSACREGEGDFIEVELGSEIAAGLHDGLRVGARKGFPQGLGQIEARHDVVSVGEIRATAPAEIEIARARKKDHVGVGEQDPAVARVGSAYGDVARVRFERGRCVWPTMRACSSGRTRKTRRRALAAGVSVS